MSLRTVRATARPESRNRLPAALPAVLGADALWDVLLGVASGALAWPGRGRWLGLPTGGAWPVYALLAVGCLVFAALLVRAARGRDRIRVARLAALANAGAAAGAFAAGALLQGTVRPGGTVVLVVAGAGCAAFAALEWLGAHG